MSLLLEVRPAEAGDHDALARIHAEVRREIGSEPTEFAVDTAGESVFVAERSGQLLGFVSVYEPESFVHHLYITSDQRGRGVGAALIARATAILPKDAWLKVDAPNTAARTFYRRLGWREEPPVEGVVVMRAPTHQPDEGVG